MKPTLYILILILFSVSACKTQEKTQETAIKEETIVPKETENTQQTEPLPVKESLFITMERTPCLGTCPSYLIQIFNTGRVEYEGRSFAKKEGKHTKTLSKDAMDEITNMIREIGFFNLQDKYDAQVTDIPSCIISVNLDGKKKKILDRYNGPNSLRELEKLIEHHVIDDELIKVEE